MTKEEKIGLATAVIAALIGGIFAIVAAEVGKSAPASQAPSTSGQPAGTAAPQGQPRVEPTASATGYRLLYSDKQVTFYAGKGGEGTMTCVQGASINTNDGTVNSDASTVDIDGWDCPNHIYSVSGGGVNLSRKGANSPTGCLDEIGSDPLSVSDDYISLHGSFCAQNTVTGVIAYVYLAKVDPAGYLTLQLTAWQPRS
jgi:hypothetical protein